MEEDVFFEAFKSLGISIKPLPANYTPDEFGRELASMSHSEPSVSYAASTDFESSNASKKE